MAYDAMVLAGLLASMLGVASILVTLLVVRTVNREAEATFRAVVMSPANELATKNTSGAVVHSVLALDGEMLVELRSARPTRADRTGGDEVMWVHSPFNLTSIITLTRWRDSNAVVDVRPQSSAVVLSNDQARVSLRRARADLAL